MEKRRMNNKGFSLVELIIVIAIMVVLGIVLVPQFIRYIESGRQSADITTITSIKDVADAYLAEKNPSANVTITVNKNKVTTNIDSAYLSAVGLKSEATLQSDGWGNSTATLDVKKFTWSVSGSTANEKEPKNDIKAVFEGAAATATPTT